MADKDIVFNDHSSLTVPRLGEACISELQQAGINSELICDLLESITTAGKIVDALPETITVKFPVNGSDSEPNSLESVIAHWKEVAGRILLVRLCADRALRDLLAGFVSGLQANNPIIACLCARACLENVGAYYGVSRHIVLRSEKIEEMVLPCLSCEESQDDLARMYDAALIAELKRFCLGTRLWPSGGCPESVGEWNAWRKNSLYETKNMAKTKDRPQHENSQILDMINASQCNVLTQLEKAARQQRHMGVLAMYDMLSEFCHPNADNRSVGVESRKHAESTETVDFVGKRSGTPGATRGITLSMISICKAVDIHVDVLEDIHNSTHDLSARLAKL